MDATAREKTKIQTSSDALLQKAYDPPQQSGLLSGFSAAALWKATGWVSDADLSAEESASTLFRFFRSRHVRDLKLIFTAALFVCLSHIALVLLIAVIDAVTGAFKSVSEAFRSSSNTLVLVYRSTASSWGGPISRPRSGWGLLTCLRARSARCAASARSLISASATSMLTLRRPRTSRQAAQALSPRRNISRSLRAIRGTSSSSRNPWSTTSPNFIRR